MIDYIENEDTEKLTWAETYPKMVEMAKEDLGETMAGKYLEKESWFLNAEVQQVVGEKKVAFKAWQRARNDNERDPTVVAELEREYREKNKTSKDEGDIHIVRTQ